MSILRPVWDGQNEQIIEVATTLERELGMTKIAVPAGITGKVDEYIEKNFYCPTIP